MVEQYDGKQKLKLLMDYWMNHNEEHIKENMKGLKKAKEMGLKEVAHHLEHVVELSEKVGDHIAKALRSVDVYAGAHVHAVEAENEKAHQALQNHTHYQLHRIGVIRTPYTHSAPRQAQEDVEGDFRIIIDPRYEEGLNQLDRFTYAFVIFYLDRSMRSASLRATPPGGGGITVGVFASRSPNRPSRLGLSIVKIKKIEANIIFTSCIDAFDRTPVVDIKPYFGHLDCKSGAGNGWAEK
jgi:tRNA-Thr(GGU) m(6)t(6)A37 methyltransferase TsaA